MKTTNEVSQRFHCNVCGKSWTGMKMEHCKSCHETFNNTRAGDKHTFVGFLYSIVKKGKHFVQVLPDEVPTYIETGHKLVSENNEFRGCLTPEEMRAKGMNQEKNGSWNMGGKAYIPKA